MVADLISERANGVKALAFLKQAAADKRNLHLTPHLVTALREAGFWPAMEQAALNA